MKTGNKTAKSRLNRKQVLFFAGILLLLAVCALWFYLFFGRQGGYVVVEIDSEREAVLSLDRDTHYRIRTKDGGYNELVIEAGRAFVLKADCPGQDCVHFAPISHSGQSIVCLPHRVNIYISEAPEGKQEREYDGMAN